MKRTQKILAAVIAVVMLFMSMAALASFAADDVVIYLTPNSNWKKDNARFAIYTWTSDSDYKWIDMTDSDKDGIYEGILPSGYTNIIFCRLTPSDSHNGWSTTWNQTADLVYDGTNNHYTIDSDSWNKGSWSAYYNNECDHKYVDEICENCGEELFYIIAGNVMKADGEYREGDNSTLFVSSWDEKDESNRMTYDKESECYVKIYENVAAGEYHFKVVKNKSWDTSYGKDGGNFYLLIEEDGSTVVITFKDGNVTYATGHIDAPEKPENSDGANDTDDSDNSDESKENDRPEEKLNFFQRIWKAITDFFKKLFGGKKK